MTLLMAFAVALYMAGHGARGIAGVGQFGSYAMVAGGVLLFVAALI